MFSEIVDDVVALSGRPDRRADIVKYVNATIRECQCLAFFARDLIEDQLTSNADPFIWTPPITFRKMRTVRYEDGRFPVLRPPGLRTEDVPARANGYYYQATTYFVFADVMRMSKIDIAYYRYLPRLLYYEPGARPATYDPATGEWSYLSASTPEAQEKARELVSNWLMFEWNHLITEGALAKLYKLLGDQRMVATYSLYKSFQNDLMSGEVSESLQY